MTANILLAAVLSALAVGDKPADDAKQELKALQGVWRLTAVEENGERGNVGKDDTVQFYFLLKGDVLSMGDGMGKYEKLGTVRLDATKKPKAMDVAWKERGKPAERARAIYELNHDTLKVAYLRVEKESGDAVFAEERPTGFKQKPADSKQKPQLRVLVLERVKEK
jgi:uncharacterized protein (TIGR03067 family)